MQEMVSDTERKIITYIAKQEYEKGYENSNVAKYINAKSDNLHDDIKASISTIDYAIEEVSKDNNKTQISSKHNKKDQR